ncbi:MAG: hypothetical protein Q8Q33_04795, partial [Chlamydiota bacterium]|nr:hypothetical protein [Chlamydiota bacterium]
MKKTIFIIFIGIILSGCLSYQQYSFEFNYDSGKAEIIYHDLCSQKGVDEKDYSIEKDWELLKETIEEFGKELDRDVIKPIKAELFQEGDVLSGKQTVEVQLPKAFPSKAAILEKLFADGDLDENLEFQVINDETFLFAHGKKIKSTNGKMIKTAKNNIVVWPEDQIVFKFSVISYNQEGK